MTDTKRMDRQQSIEQNCRYCAYARYSPEPLQIQIELCQARETCALWPERPYKESGDTHTPLTGNKL